MTISDEVNLFITTVRKFNPTAATWLEGNDWNAINGDHHRWGKRLRRIFCHNLEREANWILLSPDRKKRRDMAKQLVSHHGINTEAVREYTHQNPDFPMIIKRLMMPWDVLHGPSSYSHIQTELRDALTANMFSPSMNFLADASVLVGQMTEAVRQADRDSTDIWRRNCNEISQNLAMMRAIPLGLARSLLPAFVITPLAQLLNTYASFWFDVSGANWTEEGPTASLTAEQLQKVQAHGAAGRTDEAVTIGFGKGPQSGFFKGNHNPDGDDELGAAAQWGAEGFVNFINNAFGEATGHLNGRLNTKVKAWIGEKLSYWRPPSDTSSTDALALLSLLREIIEVFKEEIDQKSSSYLNDTWVYSLVVEVALAQDSDSTGEVARGARMGENLVSMIKRFTVEHPERFRPNLPQLRPLQDGYCDQLKRTLTCFFLRQHMSQNLTYYCSRVTDYSAQTTKCLDHKHNIGSSLRKDLLQLGIVTEMPEAKQPDREKVMFHDFSSGPLYFGKSYQPHNTKLIMKDWVWNEQMEETYLRSIRDLLCANPRASATPPIRLSVPQGPPQRRVAFQ